MTVNVIMSGLPGDMATRVYNIIKQTDNVELARTSNPVALTGLKIKDQLIDEPYRLRYAEKNGIDLVAPESHDDILAVLKDMHKDSLIGINFATKEGFDVNFKFAEHKIPFIYGGTGATDEQKTELKEAVRRNNIPAIMSSNMCSHIVGLQKTMNNISNISQINLAYHNLSIIESHQEGKQDTSGTAKDMINYFNKMGTNYQVETLKKGGMIREPEEQLKIGIPKEYLSGHGWHNYILYSQEKSESIDMLANLVCDFMIKDPLFLDYQMSHKRSDAEGIMPKKSYLQSIIKKLTADQYLKGELFRFSKDKTVGFSVSLIPKQLAMISHNINGRDPYALGAIKQALPFLVEKAEKGRTYEMIDII